MSWRKSSRSGPNCDNCWEVLVDEENDQVLVRDDKVSREIGDKAPTLRFTTAEWGHVIELEKNHKELTAAALGGAILVVELGEGRMFASVPNSMGGHDITMSDQPDAILSFYNDETVAFGEGVRLDEFSTSLQVAASGVTAVIQARV